MNRINNKLSLVFFMIPVIALFLALFLFFWFTSYAANRKLPLANFKLASTLLTVEVADTYFSRAQGLSGHPKLKDNEGMIFIFERKGRPTFWMKGMKFGLDFIWIDGETVVDITENVPAPQSARDLLSVYRPAVDADKVLEVNAGFVAKNRVKIGDTAVFDKKR